MSNTQPVKLTGIQSNKFMKVMSEFFESQDLSQTMDDLNLVIDAIKDEDTRETLITGKYQLDNMEFRFKQIVKFIAFMQPIYIQNLPKENLNHGMKVNDEINGEMTTEPTTGNSH